MSQSVRQPTKSSRRWTPQQRQGLPTSVAKRRRSSRRLSWPSAIQVLQAPHIAEPSDAEMDRLEAQDRAARQSVARGALERLSAAAAPAVHLHVEAARAALDRFDALSAQLITLSRRNTNVRSSASPCAKSPP